MALELSNITFTDKADIVPPSGVKEILINTGIANTLAGDDILNGETENKSNPTDTLIFSGIFNSGTLNTDVGNDILTGISNDLNNNLSWNCGIYNEGTIDTGDGNDIITGINQISNSNYSGQGILQEEGSTIDTGNGNDIISGISSPRGSGIATYFATTNTGHGDDTISGNGNVGIYIVGSIFNTGDGDDIIIGKGNGGGNDWGLFNYGGNIDTGDGNDIIDGTGIEGIVNLIGIINTGNGADSIISHGLFSNYDKVFLGDGNDSIFADANFPSRSLDNFDTIETGDGNDIISSTGVIYNDGVINTGNGDDLIIANEGFESGSNSSGAWFLGEGEDYIKGFGSGDFYGGNGLDILELTPGTYTVGIGGEGGESPIFTKGNQLMITSEFEILLAGGTVYDFASLTAGQIIVVA
jgi:hypothetical protein